MVTFLELSSHACWWARQPKVVPGTCQNWWGFPLTRYRLKNPSRSSSKHLSGSFPNEELRPQAFQKMPWAVTPWARIPDGAEVWSYISDALVYIPLFLNKGKSDVCPRKRSKSWVLMNLWMLGRLLRKQQEEAWWIPLGLGLHQLGFSTELEPVPPPLMTIKISSKEEVVISCVNCRNFQREYSEQLSTLETGFSACFGSTLAQLTASVGFFGGGV